MEEEWMRDQALLLDLLKKSPQVSPQELAQVTGRSVSWVKKWCKRLTECDPHDPHLLCSRSRAHHAPYFRWDVEVTKRIVEMRYYHSTVHLLNLIQRDEWRGSAQSAQACSTVSKRSEFLLRSSASNEISYDSDYDADQYARADFLSC